MADRRAKDVDDSLAEKAEEKKPPETANGTVRNGTRANGDGTSPASPGRGQNLDGTPPASPGRGQNVKTDASSPGPSISPGPVTGPWRSYKEIVAQLAGRIVEAQKPIRGLH